MFTVSSAAVAPPAIVRLLIIIICYGQLMVTNLNTVEAKESEENQNRKAREAITDCSQPPVVSNLHDPVCGSDGITYYNSDALSAEMCKKPSLVLGHEGVCIGDCQYFGGESLGDKCLYFSGKQVKLSWEAAKIECSKKIGELAMFAEDPQLYFDKIKEREQHPGNGIYYYWVGGSDTSKEGDWEWNNGVSITDDPDFPWGEGRPGEGTAGYCLGVWDALNGYDVNPCNIKFPYICEIGCPFNGVIYPPGAFIEGVCALLQCDGHTGKFNNHGYDRDHCQRCLAWGDPHIKRFDSSESYVTKKTGDCSLIRDSSKSDPSIAVDGEFVDCLCNNGKCVSCVGDVSFKNDENTILTCSFDETSHKMEVQVNGKDVVVAALTSVPSLVNVGGIDYPVLAWTSTYERSIGYTQSCLTFQGSSRILVQFCGDHITTYANSVNIWAEADIISNLKGFCGIVGNNDEVCTTSSKIKSKKASDDFTLAHQTTNCQTNSSLQDIFQDQCDDAISNGVFTAHADISQSLIDACVFDLCHVSDPDEWMGSIHAAMPNHHEIKEKTAGHCEHRRTHKCMTHKGTCILKAETCSGIIIEKGCHGQKCICCAPNPCEQNQDCLKKQGKCILRKDWASCDGGVNSELCSGKDCACCYPKVPEATCRDSKICSKKRGNCIASFTNCDGKIFNKWCPGEDCACCISRICPEGYIMSGPSNQCFKLIQHDQWMQWSDTVALCNEMGLVLPEPEDPLQLREDIRANIYLDLLDNPYLNARGDGTSFVWQRSGKRISNNDLLWRPNHWSEESYPGTSVGSNYCLRLYLITLNWSAEQYPDTPYISKPCEGTYGEGTYGVTLCELIKK